MNPAAVVGALLMLSPRVSDAWADRHAATIAIVSPDEDAAAALVVIGTRESGWGYELERCRRLGIGGSGVYGLGFGYWRWSCGTLKMQATMALQALTDKGWDKSPRHAFAGYLGATERATEAKERLALWQVTRARIACSCCL